MNDMFGDFEHVMTIPSSNEPQILRAQSNVVSNARGLEVSV